MVLSVSVVRSCPFWGRWGLIGKTTAAVGDRWWGLAWIWWSSLLCFFVRVVTGDLVIIFLSFDGDMTAVAVIGVVCVGAGAACALGLCALVTVEVSVGWPLLLWSVMSVWSCEVDGETSD